VILRIVSLLRTKATLTSSSTRSTLQPSSKHALASFWMSAGACTVTEIVQHGVNNVLLRKEQRCCCCTTSNRAAVLEYLTQRFVQCIRQPYGCCTTIHVEQLFFGDLTSAACRTTELVLRATIVAGIMNACALAAQARTTSAPFMIAKCPNIF
jgi:hypothetical protein